MNKSEDRLINRRFKVIREIGSGSLCGVFESTDLESGEPLAIKLLFPELQ